MDEDRLRDALHAAAREASTEDVVERVHAKRVHRHAVRRFRQGALTAGLLVVVVAASIVVLDERADQQQVAVAPGPGTLPRARVIEGGRARDAAVTRVRLAPDEGYVRGPLLVGGDGTISMAAYDRDGDTFEYPPSRIVRIRRDGRVVDEVELQGEILSLSEGEGARWALTRDRTVIGPEDPEFRVKRIGPSGSVTSNAVPPGEQPVGRIAAGGGGVWVPVRDGVLRFDPATGAYAGKVTLAQSSDRRAVVTGGKFFFVTDANRLVRLDPAQMASVAVIDEVDATLELVDATYAGSIGAPILLGKDVDTGGSVVTDMTRALTLHDSFTAETIHAVGDVVWVDGAIDGVRALAVLDADGRELTIARTIRLTNAGDDLDAVLLSKRLAFVTARGLLSRAAFAE